MLDTVGCARGAAIETFTGQLVDITAIEPELINIYDIAHSLAHQCRYCGHSSKFLSVAEHSVNVEEHIGKRFPKDRRLRLAALLHDGSEAYLCDVPRPLKPLLKEYAVLEGNVQEAIHKRYGIEVDEIAHDLIKEADNAVLKAEAHTLMYSKGQKWGMDKISAAIVEIACLPPQEAEALFLEAFWRLVA